MGYRKRKKIIVFFGFIKFEGPSNVTYTKGFGDYYLPKTESGFGDIDDASYSYEKIERPDPTR